MHTQLSRPECSNPQANVGLSLSRRRAQFLSRCFNLDVPTFRVGKGSRVVFVRPPAPLLLADYVAVLVYTSILIVGVFSLYGWIPAGLQFL